MIPGGKRTLLLGGICLLTGALLYVTYKQGPLYTSFYAVQEKPAGSTPLKILLVSGFCLLTFGALRESISAWKFLVIGVAVGTTAQFAFGYTEGRGFEGIRGRAVAGHGQFVTIALATHDVVRTIRDYEGLAVRGKLGDHPRTKPPGTLLFYVLTERISRLFVTHTYDEDKRAERFIDFLAIVWPFVATLAILPLYWIATLLAGPAEARLAAALYLLVPSFNLITEHTDQVLFPFLFVSVLALFVWSLHAKRESELIVRGLAAGAALWVAVFCHFPLALAAVFWPGLWAIAFFTGQWPRSEQIRATSVLTGSVLTGLLVPSLVAWVLLNYNPLVRWHAALAFHAAWRRVPAVVGLEAGTNNIAEFVDWTGLAPFLLSLAVFWVGRAARRADDHPQSLPHMALMASLMCVVVYLAFYSRTIAEIARLWMFLMPVVCLVAARTLSELRKTHWYAVPVIFALQFATVYMTKIRHDFW